MALISVEPTKLDVAVADIVAKTTRPPPEHLAEALTWCADEHVCIALAGAWWLYALDKSQPQRRASTHVLASTLVASVLPHLLKKVFDQTRPDRLTVRGHLHGVPLSGRRRDAFPSGHAIHVGALASAASVLPTRQRNAVWGFGAAIAATRVMLLAHWLSDVIVGLAVGIGVERLIRLATGYPVRFQPPGQNG